jgi:hypothetical protein
MTDITAPTQFRPWLKDELARVGREINEMRREIGILQEGLNDLEVERSHLIDQLERLDQLYESEAIANLRRTNPGEHPWLM